jgi:hypothetical protein
MNTELIRQSYRPASVLFLLVGESPPASGKFFYVNSNMTVYTARAFEKAYGKSFASTQDFLDFFKKCGCYLDDLSHIPVDALSKGQRGKCLRENIEGLAQRIHEVCPQVIAIALRRIESYVRTAINKAGCSSKVFVLPFAGNGHQNKYIDQLSFILKEYLP